MKLPRHSVDLYLGSFLGGWALEHVEAEQIGTVFTLDPKIAESAVSRRYRVILAGTDFGGAVTGTTALSVHYPRVFPETLINRYQKMYNLHPGYLPWGRGFYPVFWALWKGELAGATLHEIDRSVDTGPIVAQIRVDCSDADTGGSLHDKVQAAEQRLFLDYWPRIAREEPLPSFVQHGAGSFHSKADFFAQKRPSNWRSLSAEDLVRLTRALTFPGYTSVEIDLNGHIIELRAGEYPLPAPPPKPSARK